MSSITEFLDKNKSKLTTHINVELANMNTADMTFDDFERLTEELYDIYLKLSYKLRNDIRKETLDETECVYLGRQTYSARTRIVDKKIEDAAKAIDSDMKAAKSKVEDKFKQYLSILHFPVKTERDKKVLDIIYKMAYEEVGDDGFDAVSCKFMQYRDFADDVLSVYGINHE